MASMSTSRASGIEVGAAARSRRQDCRAATIGARRWSVRAHSFQCRRDRMAWMALRLTPNLAARGCWLMPAAASCRISRICSQLSRLRPEPVGVRWTRGLAGGVGHGAQHEVLGSQAGRVVAGVQHHVTGRDGVVQVFPQPPGGAAHPAGNREGAVPVAVGGRGPQPAVAGGVDLLPEPLADVSRRRRHDRTLRPNPCRGPTSVPRPWGRGRGLLRAESSWPVAGGSRHPARPRRTPRTRRTQQRSTVSQLPREASHTTFVSSPRERAILVPRLSVRAHGQVVGSSATCVRPALGSEPADTTVSRTTRREGQHDPAQDLDSLRDRR